MRKKWTDRLPDVFGRRRIWELECELESAQGEIEELCAEAGTVSADFEKDCWRSMRRLLERCKFDWRDVDSEGVTADAAEEFILEFINDLDGRLDRARNPTSALTDAATQPRASLSDLIEQSKARLAAMTEDERQAMWQAQRESFARAMSTPCEHGIFDYEQCVECRNPTPTREGKQ